MLANDVKIGAFPPFEFILAAFDGAYTEKGENDPSALTVWGLWMQGMGEDAMPGDLGNPKVMLMAAWQKRLTLHGGAEPEIRKGETKIEFESRRRESWGVVEHIADTCRKHRVDKLLIESKATGITVAQEMRRLFSREKWTVQLVDPGKLDKVARAYAIQHLFSDGMIWRPETEWAQMVEDQCASFPKGAHDDLVDTTSMALTHMRRMGFAARSDESRAAVEEMLFPSRPKPKRLYEV